MSELFYTIAGVLISVFTWGYWQWKRAEKAELQMREKRVDEILKKSTQTVQSLDRQGRADLGNELLRKHRANPANRKK